MTQSSPSAESFPGEHLDGLMERALSGKLSEGERVELEEHTERCAACAALLQLGPALAEKVGEGAPDQLRDQRLVARALSTSARPVVARRTRLVVALAAAALLLGSLAAAKYAGMLALGSAAAPSEPAAKRARIAQPPAGNNVRAGSLAAPPTPAEPVSAGAAKASPVTATAEAAPESASALFAQANQLRRAGQDSAAIALYRKLQQGYPRSNEATLSHATLGSLLLQHGDAQGALPQFDRYIAHGGPVLQEALAGRARALGQLGERAAEAQAWQKLLERFPASVHAARAHARLAELR